MDPSIKEMVKLLHDKYGKSVLTRAEAAQELNISISTMTKRVAKGVNLPNYIKADSPANASVMFPIAEVAKYLSQTIKVL